MPSCGNKWSCWREIGWLGQEEVEEESEKQRKVSDVMAKLDWRDLFHTIIRKSFDWVREYMCKYYEVWKLY